MRILCLALVLVFALVGCSDDSETKDAAVVDAAVDVPAQLEASAEASTDLAVTDSSSDTVTEGGTVSDAAGE
jgi:uncharacterized lipoprotein NlpE involved in copper resistance